MEETYTTEHCIWLIDVVASLASEATLDSLFGRTSTLDEQIVHEYMDECYEPKIIKHFIEVLNELGKARSPEEF